MAGRSAQPGSCPSRTIHQSFGKAKPAGSRPVTHSGLFAQRCNRSHTHVNATHTGLQFRVNSATLETGTEDRSPSGLPEAPAVTGPGHTVAIPPWCGQRGWAATVLAASPAGRGPGTAALCHLSQKSSGYFNHGFSSPRAHSRPHSLTHVHEPSCEPTCHPAHPGMAGCHHSHANTRSQTPGHVHADTGVAIPMEHSLHPASVLGSRRLVLPPPARPRPRSRRAVWPACVHTGQGPGGRVRRRGLARAAFLREEGTEPPAGV